jgi:DNA-binding protein HU-beta
MNKTEFIEKLSKELDTSKAQASRYLDQLFKCIATSLKESGELRFIGFGAFRAKETKAKEIKTPRGTMAKVPAQRRVSFSVGSDFKSIVNEK